MNPTIFYVVCLLQLGASGVFYAAGFGFWTYMRYSLGWPYYLGEIIARTVLAGITP